MQKQSTNAVNTVTSGGEQVKPFSTIWFRIISAESEFESFSRVVSARPSNRVVVFLVLVWEGKVVQLWRLVEEVEEEDVLVVGRESTAAPVVGNLEVM